MISDTTPPGAALFTPGDLASFHRVAVGWIHRDLCGAVRRTQVDGADILLAMRAGGSAEPLWGVEKYPDQTYWLVDRSRRALAFGATMDEVLRHLDLPAGQAAAVH